MDVIWTDEDSCPPAFSLFFFFFFSGGGVGGVFRTHESSGSHAAWRFPKTVGPFLALGKPKEQPPAPVFWTCDFGHG